MKKILALTLSAIIAGSCFALDTEAFVPAGNISSYTKTEFQVTSKFGDYFRAINAKHVHIFDGSGLKTETITYNAKDELVDKISYSYDTSRNLKAITWTDSTGNVGWTSSLEYQADGKIKSESEFTAGGKLTSKIMYKYNGLEVTESFYDGDGKLLSRSIKTVDANDNLLVCMDYFGDGSFDSKSVYTYLENGKLNTVEVFDDANVLISKTVYKYSSEGLLSEIHGYNGHNILVSRTIYKNDAKGNPTKISVYEISEKFGTIVNELQTISEYAYKSNSSNAK